MIDLLLHTGLRTKLISNLLFTCSCGANPQQKNSRGQTALDLAIKKQLTELTDLIAAHISHQLLTSSSTTAAAL